MYHYGVLFVPCHIFALRGTKSKTRKFHNVNFCHTIVLLGIKRKHDTQMYSAQSPLCRIMLSPCALRREKMLTFHLAPCVVKIYF
jgi:hypothetical protein